MSRESRTIDALAPERVADDNGFYRAVVAGMRCGIVTVDHDGRILTVNRLAREILELDGCEPGRPVREALSRHPRLAEVLLDSLEMSHLPNRAEMEIRSREDDGRTIGFTISPIHSPQGRLEGVALFFKDLTIVERREEQERLRDRLAALGQMAASLAHEIRNPLASIDVTATLLRRKIDDPEQRRLVEKILAEVARMNRTVAHGLEFARPLVPERTACRVAELVDDALEEAATRFPGHRVVIERSYDERAPRIPVDRTLVFQVLLNLIVNAFEALEGMGRLTCRVRPVTRGDLEPTAVEIEIEDDGPGIAEDVREKIFHPFVTTKSQGSGIGLAMARKIVECHHGRIDVESVPGAGTTFRVRLPGAVGGDGATLDGE